MVAFMVAFLGAYLCQILKEMSLISLGSFAFLVHVLLQDLDLMANKKCSTRNFDFPTKYTQKVTSGSFPDDVLMRIDWAYGPIFTHQEVTLI